MPKVSFYLKRPDDKNNTAVFARISYLGQRLKYYTPQSVNPAFWNAKTQRAKETAKFPQYPEFNRALNDFVSLVDKIYDKYRSDNGVIPSSNTLKSLLDARLKEVEQTVAGKPTLFNYYEDFAQRSKDGTRFDFKSKRPIAGSTAKGYKSSLEILKGFQKVYKRKIDFETIDLDFYNDFIKHLTDQKLSTNYIGDQIKRLKAVLSEATEKGINSNYAFKSRYFTKPTEEVDNVYLTDAELADLEALDLTTNRRLEKVRDLFLIGCYTGLRYSDFSALRPNNIKNGIISIKQVKTGDPVAVPVHKVVKRIIQKYNGELPAAASNQKTNEYIKEAAKEVESLKATVSLESKVAGKKVIQSVPKWRLISSHTARRSFATNEYLKGTPAITIMAITGHKTEKAFLKYIKITPDGHAQKMRELWDARENKLKAV